MKFNFLCSSIFLYLVKSYYAFKKDILKESHYFKIKLSYDTLNIIKMRALEIASQNSTLRCSKNNGR